MQFPLSALRAALQGNYYTSPKTALLFLTCKSTVPRKVCTLYAHTVCHSYLQNCCFKAGATPLPLRIQKLSYSFYYCTKYKSKQVSAPRLLRSCAYRLAAPIPLQSFCCICLHRQGSSLRSELVFRLCKPQKGLGWKFGFASLHVLLQSLSE